MTIWLPWFVRIDMACLLLAAMACRKIRSPECAVGCDNGLAEKDVIL
jgi:hypothetical protein